MGPYGKLLALVVGLTLAAPAPRRRRSRCAKWKIHYRAHNGVAREAYVLLPASYNREDGDADPARDLAARPRRQRAREHADLGRPARRGASSRVVSPDGQGRKLGRYSWGSAGQIEDLARMPQIVRLALPWVQIDSHRIYAFGGSMGGQETLLLLARHPRLLAGAAVFDAVTDLAMQYRKWPSLALRQGVPEDAGRCRSAASSSGSRTRRSARRRGCRRGAYGSRSPITYVRGIARSCVPLQLWWSPRDQIVIDQTRQTGHFYDELLAAESAGAGLRLRRVLEALGRDAREDAAAARARHVRPARRAVVEADTRPALRAAAEVRALPLGSDVAQACVDEAEDAVRH